MSEKKQLEIPKRLNDTKQKPIKVLKKKLKF